MKDVIGVNPLQKQLGQQGRQQANLGGHVVALKTNVKKKKEIATVMMNVKAVYDVAKTIVKIYIQQMQKILPIQLTVALQRGNVIGVELVMLTPGHVVQTVNPVKNLKEIVTMMTNVKMNIYVERTIAFLSIQI